MSHDRFETVNSGGGNYYKVSYELEMRLDAAISFRLIFEGAFLSLGGMAAPNYKQAKSLVRLLPIMVVRRWLCVYFSWIPSSS